MSFEALRALIIASGYELRFRENEWVECLMLRDGEAWLGRGRDRTSALHRAVHLACPSSLARELLTSRVEHLIAEAAAASAEHREKVLDAIANEAPETAPPFGERRTTPSSLPRAPMQTIIPARDHLRPYPASAASAALPGTEDLRAYDQGARGAYAGRSSGDPSSAARGSYGAGDPARGAHASADQSVAGAGARGSYAPGDQGAAAAIAARGSHASAEQGAAGSGARGSYASGDPGSGGSNPARGSHASGDQGAAGSTASRGSYAVGDPAAIARGLYGAGDQGAADSGARGAYASGDSSAASAARGPYGDQVAASRAPNAAGDQAARSAFVPAEHVAGSSSALRGSFVSEHPAARDSIAPDESPEHIHIAGTSSESALRGALVSSIGADGGAYSADPTPSSDALRSYPADPLRAYAGAPPAHIDPLRAYSGAGSSSSGADLLRAYPGVSAPTKTGPIPAMHDAEARAGRSTAFFDRPRSTPRAFNAPPPLVRRDVSAPRVVDPPRALEELDILLERIRDSRDELGLCSPERQRLAMLAWICEGRAHTDTFPDDLRIRERVGSISRQLTEIGKTFWPGSVTALQLQMQPRDLPRHVLGGAAPTWSRAAELSERALHALEYSDERRGFDAYGWADIGHAFPLPENPGELMEQVIREVEACGGPLLPHAAPRDGDSRPDSASYARWVRSLRWLRAADVDPDRWGRLAGRLRWWATHRDPQHAVGARELEASYAPEHAWAHELGMPLPIDGLGLEHEGETNGKAVNGLLDTVRGMTSGKRLVFVSNRRDPDLELRLKDLLPEAALEWRVAEPKRIETLGESIQQGAFDVVLAAIGFQSLATDHLLARACRLARVKYLRVNRGRPNACIRALARP